MPSWTYSYKPVWYEHSKKKPKPEDVRKHIKFTAELLYPRKNKVRVVILEQTHRRGEFGSNSEIFKHNGFVLYSMDYPRLNTIVNTKVHLRGYSAERDLNPIYMSLEQYKGFKEAVLAYNALFAGDKANKSDVEEVKPIKKKARASSTNAVIQASAASLLKVDE